MSTYLKGKTGAGVGISPEPQAAEKRDGPQDCRSLCWTCVHIDNCIHKVSHEEPVYECNEFEISHVSDALSESLSGFLEERAEIAQVVGSAKGLCVNCEFKDTCMFADTVYGVWHCEEYK